MNFIYVSIVNTKIENLLYETSINFAKLKLNVENNVKIISQ